MFRKKMHLFILLSSTAYMLSYINWHWIKGFVSQLTLLVDSSTLTQLDAEITSLFDSVHVIPIYPHKYKRTLNYEVMLITLKKLISKIDSSHYNFYSFNEFNVENIAKLRSYFNIAKFNTYKCYRNKVLMRDLCPSFFGKHQLIQPKKESFKNLRNKLGFPFVIKPIDGAGSFDVKIINSEVNFDEFLAVFQNIEMNSFVYMAEEYIEGDLYHADIVYANGQIVFEAVSKYNRPLSYFNEGYTVGSITIKQNSDIALKLKKINHRLIPSDNLVGSIHTEFFVRDDKIHILETAHRPPGGPITKMYQAAFRQNILELEILSLLNVKLDKSYLHNYAYWSFVPPKAGKILKINSPNFSGIKELQCFSKVNDILQAPTSLRDKIFSIMGCSICFKEICNEFGLVNNHVFIEVEMDN